MKALATEVFERERPRLLALAYQMLGEIQAAEDIVQECWIRWDKQDQTTVDAPGAWLSRVVTHLAIDQLRSARVRREQYKGPWLPEPILGEGPADVLELARECELALLWSLERLNAEERAGFLLTQVFDMPYKELAKVLNRSDDSTRQLVSRARKRLATAQPRFKASSEQVEQSLMNFASAAVAGNKEEVIRLLAPDVMALTDGGGEVTAAIIPLHGPDRVAQVLTHVASRRGSTDGVNLLPVNGYPGLARLRGDDGDLIMTLRLNADGKICWIYMLRNPHKLAAAQRTLSRRATH